MPLNDYVVNVILEAKTEGLAAFSELNIKMDDLVAHAALAHAALERMNETGRQHSSMLRNMGADLERTAAAGERMADSLASRLTPALNNVGTAASTASNGGGGGGGIMGFIQGMIPGQQTAGNIVIAITALAAAFAPLSLELISSIALLGAWVVGMTALIAVVSVAAVGIGLLVGGILALGIAQMGGLNSAQALTTAQNQATTAANAHSAAVESLNQMLANMRQQAEAAAASAATAHTSATDALKMETLRLQAQGQTQLATATQQNEAAQEALARAQLAVSSSAAPTALQLQSLKFAQEQAAESAAKLTEAQKNVTGQGYKPTAVEAFQLELLQRRVTESSHQLSAAQQNLGGNGFKPTAAQALQLKNAQEQIAESADKAAKAQQALAKAQQDAQSPIAMLQKHIEAMIDVWEKSATPMAAAIIQWGDALIPRVQALGQALMDWFGPRLPAVLKIATDAVNGFFGVITTLGTAWGEVVQHVLDHPLPYEKVFGIFVSLGVEAIKGLLQNLLALSDWFIERLPVLQQNADSFFGNFGWLIKGLGIGLGVFIDWIIVHWPEINRIFNITWGAIKEGINAVMPLIVGLRKNWEDMQPALKFLGEHGSQLRLIFQAMAITVGILITVLLVLIGLLILLGVGLVALLAIFIEGVKKLTEFWHELQKIADIAKVIGETAWPTLKKAGEELKKAFDPLMVALDELAGGHNKVVDASGHMEGSFHRVQTTTEDTRNALVRFLTSPAVIGIATFFAVTMPRNILATVTTLVVLIDTVTLAMTLMTYQIKVAADIMRGDWTQAGKDLEAGTKATTGQMQKLWVDTNTAVIANQALTDGTLTAEQKRFGEDMLHLFDTTKAGVITTERQKKNEQLQIMRETQREAVGGSIIPDMVNAILWWYENLRGQTAAKFGQMRDHTLEIVQAIAAAFFSLSGSIRNALNDGISVLDSFLDKIAAIPGLPHWHIDLIEAPKAAQAPSGVHSLATGGVISGFAPGRDTVPAMLSPGEGVLIPQAVRGLGGPSAINALNAQYFAAGGVVNPYPAGQCTYGVYSMFPGMPVDGDAHNWINLPLAHAPGPEPGTIVVYGAGPGYSQYGHVARVDSGLVNGNFLVTEMNYKGLGVWDQRWSSMAGVSGFLRPGVRGEPGGANSGPGGGIDLGFMVDDAFKATQGALDNLSPWSRGLTNEVMQAVARTAKSLLSTFTGGGPSGSVTGDHAAILHAAEKLTGVGQDWDKGLDIIIQHESGWRTDARNNTDSNARAGNASVGLMQLTGKNRDRYDHGDESAVGQVAGGIRYILDTYKNINNVPGVRSILHGGGYVPYDSGGGLRPGMTMAYNGTGRTETVTPASTMDRVEGLLGQVVQELRSMNNKPRLGTGAAAGQFG